MKYEHAGVNISEGNSSAQEIQRMARTTHSSHVHDLAGGFAGRYNSKIASTDGVGTKLLVAIEANQHDYIGQDLVAMCANDLAVYGSTPEFFLDYFATGTLEKEKVVRVVAGIVKACKEISCALIGGETAEMPGVYQSGHYDLAGFCVGSAHPWWVLDKNKIQPGQIVYGLISSGVHANGFSLVRKALGDKTSDYHKELLTPTKLYSNTICSMLNDTFDGHSIGADITAMANITGGGLVENIPRVLPDNLGVELNQSDWERPAIFDVIKKAGDIPEAEMRRVFNLGIGFVVIARDMPGLAEKLNHGYGLIPIGGIVNKQGVYFNDR